MKFLNDLKSAWSAASADLANDKAKRDKAAADAKIKRLAENKHIADFEERHLLGDEEVMDWVPAQRMRDLFGVAVLTTKRFVWYRSGVTGQSIEPWPLNKINSVEVKPGLVGIYLKLHTGTDTLHLNINDKEDGLELVRSLQIALNGISSGLNDEPQTRAGPDHIEQLRQLAGLRDAGILSEVEFAAKKAELLSRI